MSDEKLNYSINLDNKFGSLQLIDIPSIVAEVKDQWFNQTLTQVNDCVVRLGVMQGEFHWHHHDDEDEFFFVLSGKFIIDLEDRSIELNPNQGFTVPRTVRHRTRAPERAVILMFEGSGVKPTGD
jgi:mannose-6-phosphate isomerase-like protein (cupin superfamily)